MGGGQLSCPKPGCGGLLSKPKPVEKEIISEVKTTLTCGSCGTTVTTDSPGL
ncbi:MAG: hypothetical protein LBG19_11440 [Prevotellaceae bacterium]|nr:hypothetical protein [Prevotellaceae bacterium]